MQTDPTKAAALWAQRMGASGQRIQDGVNAVTVAPGQSAARQADVWVQNTTAAKTKFAKNVAAVSLDTWRADMLNKGIPRIATGATAAQPKMESFLGKFLPYVANGVRSLPPRGGLDQNINRMVAMVRHNANFSNAA